jgi:cysteine desulfurase
MTSGPIYLDHNATTPVHPAVRDAMLPWLGEQWGNPSSGHAFGRAAAAAVAEGRARVATLIGARPEDIVFTGGGTEADNLAVLGPELAHPRLVISAVEHPAVDVPARVRRARGCSLVVLPVDGTGQVDLAAAQAELAQPCGLLSVILAQNETGVIQPVARLAQLARERSPAAIVHTDAAQAVGKIPVDVEALGVDLLTVVSHKLYGPCGIGALFVREGVSLQPLTHGGGQERGLRPGTEPVALIVGLGAACALASADLAQESARQAALRDELWARLSTHPAAVQTGEGAPRLPNTLHVRFEGFEGAGVLARAPAVAASTGSACHTDDAAASGVLGAMGVDARSAAGAVRLSVGRRTTAADIERAATSLLAALG